MNISDVRKQIPELADLDDDQVVNAIHEAYYPDLPLEDVAKHLGYKPQAAADAPAPERTFMGTVGDTALSLGKGMIGVPEAAVGLADLATGGRVGKALEEGVEVPGTDGFRLRFDPKAAKGVLDEGTSEAQKHANKQVMEAEGLWETIKAAVRNPSVAAQSAVESIPLMGAGGLVARGLAAAGARGALAVGAGEGVAMAGGAAEQIRQQTADGLLTGEQAALAGATGAAGAAFGALGAKIAAKLGLADVDALISGAATNPKAAKGIVRMTLEGAAAEGLLEELPQSVSEQVLQNIALGRPIEEGVNQAAVLGTMAGGLMGGAVNLYRGATTPAPAPSPAPTPAPGQILDAPSVDSAIDMALQAVGGSITGTDPASLMERPDGGFMAQARQGAVDREQDALGDISVDKMRREAMDEAQSLRQYDPLTLPRKGVPTIDEVIQPNDLLTPKTGAPFTPAAAKLKLKALRQQGKDAQLVEVAEGGYILRPLTKGKTDDTQDQPASPGGAQPVSAPASAPVPELVSDAGAVAAGTGAPAAVRPGAGQGTAAVAAPAGVPGNGGQHGRVAEAAPAAEILTGKSALFDGVGAARGSLSEGNRRQLMVDPAGGYYWGDWKQSAQRDVGAVAGGADAAGTPASFSSSKEARAAAENTPADKTTPAAAPTAPVGQEERQDAPGNGAAGQAGAAAASGTAPALSEKQARADFAPAFYELTTEEAEDLAVVLRHKLAKRGSLSRDDIPAELGNRIDTATWMRLKDAIAAHPAALVSHLESKAGANNPEVSRETQALTDKVTSNEQDPAPGAEQAQAPAAETPAPAGGDAPAGAAPAPARNADLEAPGVTPAPGKPAPLYAQRKVLNAEDILTWAKAQGFTQTVPADDLHVTMARSREPMDSAKVGNQSPAYTKGLIAGKAGREVAPLGDDGAVVLKFASPVLQTRFTQFRKAGASWDFESFQPHITITYDAGGLDLSKVEPYTGPIQLGPELVEPLNLDAKEEAKASEEPTAVPAAPKATPQVPNEPGTKYVLPSFVGASAGAGGKVNLRGGKSSANTPMAPPAPKQAGMPSVAARWDAFMPVERRDMLTRAGYTDADQARVLPGTPWTGLTDPVRRALDGVHRQDAQAASPAAAPAPKKDKGYEALLNRLETYFQPGNIVNSYGGHDRVIAFQRESERGGWSVQVHAVVKQDDTWVDDPKDNRDRWHSTQPTEQELRRGPVQTGTPAQAGYVAAPPPASDQPRDQETGQFVASGESAQFAAYRQWIEEQDRQHKLENGLAPGMRQEIERDERLKDGEAERLLAMAAKPITVRPAGAQYMREAIERAGMLLYNEKADEFYVRLPDYEYANAKIVREGQARYVVSSRGAAPFGPTTLDAAVKEARRRLDAVRATEPKADAPAPAAKPAASANTVFTDDAAARAREVLRKKLSTPMSGLDPELVQAGMTLAGWHVEKGARTFAAYAKAMLEDMGEAIRPHLKSFYMGLKYSPDAAGFSAQMSSAAFVEEFDLSHVAAPSDTQTPGTTDTGGQDGTAARNLDSTGPAAPEGAPADAVRAPAGGGDAGAAPGAGRDRNQPGDSNPDEPGRDLAGGLGAGAGDIPVPAGRARRQRADAQTGRVSGAPRPDDGPGLFDDAGREGAVNPAPNAPPIGANQPTADEVADFIIEDDLALGEGGQKTKFRNNLAAIRLAKDLLENPRHVTGEEQRTLALYVGWGGLPQAFDANNADWAKEHAELKEVLSEAELAAARRSTRYAHYTSREIIQDGIYAALRRFGFAGGRVLEGGAGVGNFIGLMPVDMRSAGRVTAIEREPIAATIARALYPLQNVQLADFTEFKGQDGYYDAAVGNPPFAADAQVDRSGRKHLNGLSLHNYFFAKEVDMLREGGILAQVVTSSFLDAAGDKARKYLSDRTRLLGAIRLPNNAFSKNAGTEVTTDIIFLQKRPEAEWGSKAAREEAKAWLDVTQIRDPRKGVALNINQYFADHPEMMLGDFGAHGTMYGPDQPALVARPGQDTTALLREAVARLPEAIYQSAAVQGTSDAVDAAVRALTNPPVQEGGYFMEDGKLLQRLPDIAGEARGKDITPETMWTAKTTLGTDGHDRIVRLSQMRTTLRELLAAELKNDRGMSALRKTLNEQYDGYVKAHGLIGDRGTARVFDDDPDFPLLLSLEHNYVPPIGPAEAKKLGIKAVKSRADKAPIFRQRVVESRQTVRKVETPADALAVSMAERGRLDTAYIGQLLGKSPEDVLQELSSGDKPLLFLDPATNEYALRDAYLSGNVRAKLAQAKEANLFGNVRALEQVQPEDVGAHQISAKIGAPWVPTAVYEEFAKELLGEGAEVSINYMKLNSSYSLYAHGAAEINETNKWGTPHYKASELLSALLNNRTIKVMGKDGEGKPYVMQEATENANTKAQDIKDRFNDWLFSDPQRSELLVRAYNDTNNNYVTRAYDGSWMTFPGKVPDSIIKFRRHQRDAIARIVQDRTTLLDHVVGAGKALDLDAKLLTPSGWIRMGDVKLGDRLITQSGRETRVTGVFPQGDKELFRVTFSDGASVECCDEHLWLTHTYKERGYAQRAALLGKDWDCAKGKVRSLAEIRKTLVAPHLGAKNHSIPIVEPVQFDARPVPLDAYTLGALLGDGYLGEKCVRFNKPDADIPAAFVLPAGVTMRFEEAEGKCPTWHLIGTEQRKNPALDMMRGLGLAGKLAHEKFVPECYKFNTLEVRLAMLRGLMDTDGWLEKNGRSICFSSASKRLADDVVFLVQSLGGVALRGTKNPKYTHNGEKKDGRVAHTLTIKMPPDINPFRSAAKALGVVPKTSYAPARYIVSVESVGTKPAQCISVDDPSRLYVTDEFIVTHNTFTIVAGAMELRRTGLARKPLVAVPNHLVKQWAADFYRLYPGANILTATKKDFDKVNRRRFLAKIATGDWDAVVIAHSSFGFIQPGAEFEAEFNERQVALIMAAIQDVAESDADETQKKRTIKQLEAMAERIEKRIERLRDKPMDALLDFEELGIDQLFVDEAHLFKNLMFTTKLQGVAGLGDSQGSQRAYDMYVKTQQVMEKNGRGQGVVFATGTPVSNSLAEKYHMMRYLMPRQMEELGFQSFDAWANTYAEVNQVWMQKPSGDGFKAQNRMSQFSNVHELLKLFDQVADTVTLADIKKAYKEENNGKDFPIPPVKTGRRQPVSLEKSPAQIAYMEDIAKRAKAIEARKGPPKKGEDNVLVLMTDARKAAMDIRLVDVDITEREPGGRIDRASAEIMDRYTQYADVKGTQLVFSDLGTPLKHAKAELKEYEAIQERIDRATDPVRERAALGADDAQAIVDDAEDAEAELDAKGPDWLTAVKAALRGFSVYDDLKTALIERGIPEHEIAFIHDYNTDEQKAGLFRKVNAGDIRVLVGSTQKMGAGTNVQERLVAEHHLDVPWRPSDVEQREGRIERQGNSLLDLIAGFEVEIMAYVTKDTLDMRMWQIQEVKLKLINQLRTRQIERDIDNAFEDMEMSAGEMQAAATGNMDLLLEIQAKNDIKKLEQKRRSFEAQKNDLISRRKSVAQRLERLPREIAEAEEEEKLAAQYNQELEEAAAAFKVTIDGKDYTDPKAASDYLLEKTDAKMRTRTVEKDGKKVREEITEEAWQKLAADAEALRAAGKTNEDPEIQALIDQMMGFSEAKAAPLDVAMNGEQYTARARLAEAFSELRGDRDALLWKVDGQEFSRRAAAVTALRQLVADAIADEREVAIGSVGPFKVTIEGQPKDKLGRRALDVLMQSGNHKIEGMIQLGETADGSADAVAGQVIGWANGRAKSAGGNKRYLTWDLEAAQRQQAELAKADEMGQWPDQDKLDAARAKHQEIRKRLGDDKPKDADEAPAFSQEESQQPSPEQRRAVGELQQLVDGITENWSKAPEVTVVASIASPAVPAAIRQEAAERVRRRGGNPKGVFYQGRVYLFADRIRSERDAATVLFHEILGHFGLRGQFGPDLDKVLEQITLLRRGEVAAMIERTKMDPNDAASPKRAAEEVLAYLAQTKPELGLVQRAIAAIKGWLRANIAFFKHLPLSDADIIQQFILPARRFVEGGGPDGPRGGELAPAFAQGRGFNTREIQVDGKWRPVETAGGEPIHPKFQGQQMFWRKWADRFEVDDKGRPKATPEQLSALFGTDPDSADILFSQEGVAGNLNDPRDYKQVVRAALGELGNTPGKLHWWHKSLGTQYNLARKSAQFKRVFDGVQDFLGDVSLYATEAANKAPTLLPKLETWRDMLKTPISAADSKAVQAPLLEGTLEWTRDAFGNPVRVEELREQAKGLPAGEKADYMVRNNLIGRNVVAMWRGLSFDQFESNVNTAYERTALHPGIVWTATELKERFKLTDKQVGLYQEARAAVDKSITDLSISDMLRVAGKDAEFIRPEVLVAGSVAAAKDLLVQQLRQSAKDSPDRAGLLNKTADRIEEKALKAVNLIAEGYFPLSRFGHYTVDVVGADGERLFFSLYESRFEAARAAREFQKLAAEQDGEFSGATVRRGTVSQEEYKLFAGVSPETIELFGEMLGLDSTGDQAADKAFQAYLQLAKNNRSSMKRLIHRKGTAGFSQDVSRVLAGFVYSNARMTSRNVHAGEIEQAITEIPKGQGELKDAAIGLRDYVHNPVEEAQALRGLLFAQYLGGSIAAALVNMTQPFTMTLPYLSQFGGVNKAAGHMKEALKVAWAKTTGDKALDAALLRATEEGIVAPQEIHQLMAQSQGRGSLKSGDGTLQGDAAAMANNALSRLTLLWGKPFSTAELFNRRVTFVAAWKAAQDTGAADPFQFAKDAVVETQGIYSKANRPRWARGAIGATIFTFKQFSIAYLELMERMWNAGEPGSPERSAGRRAVFFAIAMLMLAGGAGGLPFADDVGDLIDGMMQRLGYNWNTKQKRQEALEAAFGRGLGHFLEKGVSGLPGVPIDVAARLGLGNLIPGTGALQKKADRSADIAELAGPAGDLVKRAAKAADLAAGGELVDAGLEVSPVAARNVAKAIEMASTGIYDDTRGYKVLDVDAMDALSKGIGFQPNAVARVQEGDRQIQQMVAQTRLRESEIAGQWAKAIVEGDADGVREAREAIALWNSRNPESPIRIKLQDVLKRAKNMRLDRAERIEKSAPKEVRAEVRRQLRERE